MVEVTFDGRKFKGIIYSMLEHYFDDRTFEGITFDGRIGYLMVEHLIVEHGIDYWIPTIQTNENNVDHNIILCLIQQRTVLCNFFVFVDVYFLLAIGVLSTAVVILIIVLVVNKCKCVQGLTEYYSIHISRFGWQGQGWTRWSLVNPATTVFFWILWGRLG